MHIKDLDKFIASMPITKIENGTISEVCDNIISEERVTIYLNGNRIISTMCLPIDQDSYAVGFLMSEGVLESVDDLHEVRISSDGLSVHVSAKINEANISNLYHEKTLTSGCCVGVSANFKGKIVEKFIDSKMRFSIEQIFDFLGEFSEDSRAFDLTGCVHKVILFCEGQRFISEDIGRHNALDKALGKARLARINMANSILIVSGRLSMEMVIKCAMHGIPVVVSRAATTLLGIKSANKLGITLIGFARDGRLSIYTHKSRIQV